MKVCLLAEMTIVEIPTINRLLAALTSASYPTNRTSSDSIAINEKNNLVVKLA
jgi:hypothetical protein